jgi:YNFM family putative membrane transporter
MTKSKNNFLLLYIVAIFTMFSLYGVQSIQPLLAIEFHLDNFQAALLTTAVMLPLGVAPLFYGYFLHGRSLKKVLRYSIFYLAIFEFIYAFVTAYEYLLLIRFLQGLAIPAVLTTLSSYISTHSSHEHIQHNMGKYIGATIIGGFSGRFLSGASSEFFGWRVFFVLLALVLWFLFYNLHSIDEEQLKSEQKSPSMMLHTFLDKKYRHIFIAIFCVFFVFSAVLNFLPFQLHIEDPSISTTAIGFIYLGYIMGLLVSFNSKKIKKLIPKTSNILRLGIVIYIIGLLLLLQDGYIWKLVYMFIFCLGMFTFHSTATGYINKIADKNKSMVNGLYISSYYLGGTAGSILPGIFYAHYGWSGFIAFLATILSGILILLWSHKSLA